MVSIFANIGTVFVSNLVQLIIGCLLSVPVFLFIRVRTGEPGTIKGFIQAALFSLLGILLPLGTYGTIPIFLALLAAGFRMYTVIPLIASNLLFNMLVPFNDPGFIWKTGIRLVILAFISGLTAGLIIKALKWSEAGLIRLPKPPVFPVKPFSVKTVVPYIDWSIKELGIYLFAGIVINTLFRAYALNTMINMVYSNPYTSFLPGFFGSHDVANPFFLLTFNIAYMLMDFVKLSAMAVLLRLKGVGAYFLYYIFLALILAIPAFI